MARDAGLIYRKSQSPVPVSTVRRILCNRLYTGDFEWLGKWECVQEILDGRNRKTRNAKTGGGVREFAFSGLISCGHCGCALTAEIERGKYIYYHCTGYHGKCPEKFVREEVLEEQFAGLLATLRFDQEIYDLTVRALKISFKDTKREHEEAVVNLRSKIDWLRKRLETVYIDKLDGTVNEDFYRRMAAQWRDELERCQRDLIRRQDASNIWTKGLRC